MYGNHYYQAPYPQAPNPYAERLTTSCVIL